MKFTASVLPVVHIWRAWRTTLSAGVFALAFIILLNFGQPNTTINTGGCSAPIGECSTG